MIDERSDGAAAVLDIPEIAAVAAEVTAEGTTTRVTGVVLGRLLAVQGPDRALVALKGVGSSAPIAARRIAGLTTADIGREVALMFEDGDPAKPTIIGLVEVAPFPQSEEGDLTRQVVFEAETIVFSGEKEIVLRCGEASVTLRRDGKVLIRGAYLLSRSSGVNRIKGGSVQIN